MVINLMEEKIPLTDTLSYYPSLCSILKTDDPNLKNGIPKELQEIVNQRVEAYKEISLKAFGGKPIALAIAPTGFCIGRCGCKSSKDGKPLCYAKDFYGITEYLTIEQLDAFIKKWDIQIASGDVIIYGGEPVYNFEAFKKLIDYLKDKCRGINVVTSLFYSDSTYEQLKKLFLEVKNFSICVSFDMPGKKRFHYCPAWGEDTYDKTFTRLKELVHLRPYYVAIRSTITEEKGYFDWLRNIEKEIGYEVPAFGDFEHTYQGDYEYFLKEADKYNQEKIKEGNDPHFFMMFNGLRSFIGALKCCDLNMSRYAVNYRGERIFCVNDQNYTNLSNIEKDNFKKFPICKNCNLYNMCLNRCFMVENLSSCKVYYGLFKQWLKFTAKTKEGLKHLLDLSVIKVDL